MSLPNQNINYSQNPFTSDEFNKNNNYINKLFVYILCRNDSNVPVRVYENEADIELFDQSEYKIIKIPFIKSYIFTKPSKPQFTPYYYKNELNNHMGYTVNCNEFKCT